MRGQKNIKLYNPDCWAVSDTINYNCVLVSKKSHLRWPHYQPKHVANDITRKVHR